ncbi:hypothetical protein ACO0LD_18460 [Undibacterium sp. Ji83W]|uniref:hypothetical protein n=1 Tax=Undibacterium sp. Ji83W TaxID=3413043 RepID=UPI003BF08556
MKKFYKDAVFFLLLHTAFILIIEGAHLLNLDWHFNENTGLARLLAHPNVAAIHLVFSSSLLLLLWFKHEKTWKLMFAVALAACIYGVYVTFVYATGADFLFLYGAGRVIGYSAPLAFPNGLGIFSKPIHRADEDGK